MLFLPSLSTRAMATQCPLSARHCDSRMAGLVLVLGRVFGSYREVSPNAHVELTRLSAPILFFSTVRARMRTPMYERTVCGYLAVKRDHWFVCLFACLFLACFPPLPLSSFPYWQGIKSRWRHRQHCLLDCASLPQYPSAERCAPLTCIRSLLLGEIQLLLLLLLWTLTSFRKLPVESL